MHSVCELNSGVPAFLGKLWRLVEDPDTDHLISWSSDGLSFIIRNQAQFARDLLPLNYKHNNMASFVRQLNMYGFHKVTSVDNGGLKFDKDEMEFSHICFLKGHPYLLEHIKRKITNNKTMETKSLSNIEEVSRVLNEVKSMKGRQESLDARFSAMKQENKALWREVAVLRQKHLKQQQIVNKLIQFLVSIVTPSRTSHLTSMGMGVKRPYQLMLGDSTSPPKIAKSGGENVAVAKKATPQQGPTIHELATDIAGNNQLSVELEDCEEDEEYILEPCISQPIIGSPKSTTSGGQPSPNRLDDVSTAQLIQTIPLNEVNVENYVAEEINPLELLDERNTHNNMHIASLSTNKSLNNTNNDLLVADNETSKYLLFNKHKKYASVNEDLQVPDMIFENDDVEEQFVDNPDPLVSGGIILDTGMYNNNNRSLVKKDPSRVPVKKNSDNMTLATVPSSSVGHKSLERLNSKDDVDHHLDNVQGELESLRDLLKGEGYLDANALLGVCGSSLSGSTKQNLTLDTGMFLKLFGSDDPLSYGIPMNPGDLSEDDGTRLKNYNDNENGLELMTYSGMQPDLIDLNDMWVAQGLDPELEHNVKTPEELNTPQLGFSTPPFQK